MGQDARENPCQEELKEQPGVEAPTVPGISPYSVHFELVGGRGPKQHGLVVSTADGLSSEQRVISTPWQRQRRASPNLCEHEPLLQDAGRGQRQAKLISEHEHRV